MMTALCVTGPPDACYGLKNGCLVSHLRTTWNARAFMFQFICTSFAVVSLYIFLLPGQDVPIKWNCSVSGHCFSDFPCQSPCCLTVLCMSSCHFGFPCSTGFLKISFYLSFCHSISCIPQWIYYFLTPTLWFDIFKVDSILSIRKKIHSNPVSLKMYFFCHGVQYLSAENLSSHVLGDCMTLNGCFPILLRRMLLHSSPEAICYKVDTMLVL